MNKNIWAGFLVAFILGFVVSNYTSFGGSSNVVNNYDMQDDYEYYKYLSGYNYLLEEEDRSKLKEFMSKMEEDEEFVKRFQTQILSFIFKENPEYADNLEKVIDDVKNKKEDKSYFEQNTSCVSLTNVIEERLDSLTEDLEVVFYSPNLDTCLYVVHSSEKDYSADSDYALNEYKKVYKTGSNTLLEKYRVYKTNQSTDENEKKKSESQIADFVRFIMDNSNYNMSILEDSSYVYVNLM